MGLSSELTLGNAVDVGMMNAFWVELSKRDLLSLPVWRTQWWTPQTEATRIGVDDFAFRRGFCYGTLIINLVTRRTIEVLNERSVSSLRTFLAAHPQAEAMCRDRDPRYVEAIRWEAPTATVLLDRWHHIRNLVDA